MKKVAVTLPDGKMLVIEEYETPIDPKVGAAEYQRLLAREERFDRRLKEMAEGIADRLEVAERGDRAIEYWEVGMLILQHRREVEREAATAGGREYEQVGRRQTRLEQKVAEIRHDRGSKKERYSRHYFRKFERFADLVSRSQASRSVPYSLQHELIYDGLTDADRDALLVLCERGEVRTNTELRRRVRDLLAQKQNMTARGSGREASSATSHSP